MVGGLARWWLLAGEPFEPFQDLGLRQLLALRLCRLMD
jgi:hypothetical protein